MNNPTVLQETRGLIKSLKSKDIRQLLLGMETRRAMLLDELGSDLESVPKGMTNTLKEQRLVINALITPIQDVFDRVEADDLLQSEMVEYATVLTKNLRNYEEFQPKVEGEDVKEESVESIFTRANKDFEEDKALLQNKGRGKNKLRIIRVKRAAAAHFDMILSEYDYNRTSLPPYRVQDGYAVIPDQRVIILDISSLPRGTNQYETVKQWMEDNSKNPNHWQVIEIPCSVEARGLSYWWVMKVDDYSVLFEEREINAWCPVTLG